MVLRRPQSLNFLGANPHFRPVRARAPRRACPARRRPYTALHRSCGAAGGASLTRMVAKSSLLVSILGAISGCTSSYDDTGCMDVPPEQTTCPSGSKVSTKSLSLPGQCGDDLEIDEVNGDGTLTTVTNDSGTESKECCYPVTVIDHNTNQKCSVGRPYLDDGAPRTAALRMTLRGVALGADGSVRDARRATAWAKSGAEEHASVASFARLTLSLMALGAPTELLAAVHHAALDEVRHAEACWELARHFGAERVTPGAFPFGGPVEVRVTLAELAYAATREGCLGETLGAHLVARAAALAPEPDVRRALAAIAAEEAEHAVLSFRIVAWALATGGAETRAAVERALSQPWPEADIEELGLRASVDVDALRAASAEGVAEVLRPATAALLAA